MAKLKTLFPPSTNDAYQGAHLSVVIFGLAVVLAIIPACIHTFLPDGGANLIAGLGLDLASDHGRQIVSLFAWAGTTQLALGLVLLAMLLRYRSFLPLGLGLVTLERILHAWNLWGPKSGDHHPPEAYVTLALIPLFALGFLLSLRQRKTYSPGDEP